MLAWVATPTTASSSPSISPVMPCFRAASVWQRRQYSQPLLALTATKTISFIKELNAPGAMASLTLSQVCLSVGGWLAMCFQKLLTSSTPRVALMSS